MDQAVGTVLEPTATFSCLGSHSPTVIQFPRSSTTYGRWLFYYSEYGCRRPAPRRRWRQRAAVLRRYTGHLGAAGGDATRNVTAAGGLSPRRQLMGAGPVPRQHGGRDPLAAAEQPARPPQQGRGAPGRGECCAPHPQGGRGYHGQRGQVSGGLGPACRSASRGSEGPIPRGGPRGIGRGAGGGTGRQGGRGPVLFSLSVVL